MMVNAAGGDSVRVRCSWNQTATATGRISSSSPNLQVCLCINYMYSRIDLATDVLDT